MEDAKSRFKRICVFCGSSSGKKATYQEAAVELGKELVMEFSKIFFIHLYFMSFFRIRSFERQSQIFLHFVSGFNQSCIVSFNGAILASKNSFFFFFSSLFPCVFSLSVIKRDFLLCIVYVSYQLGRFLFWNQTI